MPGQKSPTELPFNRALLVENTGSVSVFLSYSEVLPEPHLGHELKPGEARHFPGNGPLYAHAIREVHLLISTLD